MRPTVLLLLVACETIPPPSPQEPGPPPGPTQIVQPTPSPPPPPDPISKPPGPPRRATTRAAFENWMPKLPDRGLFVAWMGLGGMTTVVVDADTRKATKHSELHFEKSPADVTKTLSIADNDKLWKLAEVAWRVDNPPKHDRATDYRQVIVAVDHADVLFVSVYGPIDPGDPAYELATAIATAAGVR